MKNSGGSRDLVRVLWILLIVLFTAVSGYFVYRLYLRWPKEGFEQKTVSAVRRLAGWYTRNQKPEGDFYYERIAATGELKPGNSIVRQAGALYGLGQAYRYTKDEETRKTLEKGIAYFETLTTTESARASSITYEDDTLSNAAALLVLGLVEYIETDPKHETTENLEYLVRLSNYLVGTQASHSAYINDYKPSVVISDYNNGETMYALIRSYAVTRQEAYLQSVKRFADYAMGYYGESGFNSSFFSWGMAGFAHLYKTAPDERYWEFLKTYSGKYMRERGEEYDLYLSGESSQPITPGSAVFIEGVDHIAWIAREKDRQLYEMLRQHAQRVLTHLLKYEIDGPYGRFATDIDSVRNAFCSQTQCETTRIDFLQHYISAVLLYFRFLI